MNSKIMKRLAEQKSKRRIHRSKSTIKDAVHHAVVTTFIISYFAAPNRYDEDENVR